MFYYGCKVIYNLTCPQHVVHALFTIEFKYIFTVVYHTESSRLCAQVKKKDTILENFKKAIIVHSLLILIRH